MTPRVSVVIVSYRSRAALEACLQSLTECARPVPLEVIVVDNASQDGTWQWVAARHPRVRLIANPDNRGFTRGVNQAVAAARAETLLLLNPDCELRPEALIAWERALADRPRAAAVAPVLVDGDGRVARSCGRFPDLWTLACDHLGLARAFPGSTWFGGYKYGGRPVERLDRVDWASGAALLIPRAAWRAIGGLDEQLFMYMEEVDWCRRAARLGWEVRVAPEVRVVHVGQQSSMQAPAESYLHNLRSRVVYFRKHFGGRAARAAQLILLASLALKWAVSRLGRRASEWARVYSAGMGVVWAA
jgi:GT2 family glycosyltransferase